MKASKNYFDADLELIEVLNALEKEKHIPKEAMFETIETALVTAYKKNFDPNAICFAAIDRNTGAKKVWAEKTVVEIVENDSAEISLEDAKEISVRYQIGDKVEFLADPVSFGRIAAQTGKQMIVQKIREIERGNDYAKLSQMENDVVTGKVSRIDKKAIHLDLGNAEGILLESEQIPGEKLNIGDSVKVYALELKSSSKSVQLMVSRTHPGLVKKFFTQEVTEIANGTVVINSIAREAGSRTKISVYSTDENVDPVGSCVGPKGARVNTICSALGGEKIDIIPYDEDIAKYISAALSPATVSTVKIDEEAKSAFVTVPDFQLSLAIGKEGQNARLAARLTGWKIDIKGDSQVTE